MIETVSEVKRRAALARWAKVPKDQRRDHPWIKASIEKRKVSVPRKQSCLRCGVEFEHLFYPTNGKQRAFCSQDCARRFGGGGRKRKLPAVEIVVRHYVEEGLGTPTIAKMYGLTDAAPVHTCLVRAGVKMRHTWAASVCKVPECGLPAHKIKHPINGAEYGTLCKGHWDIHRRRIGREINRRARGVTPDRYENYRLYEPENEDYHWLQKGKKQLKELRRIVKDQRAPHEALPLQDAGSIQAATSPF